MSLSDSKSENLFNANNTLVGLLPENDPMIVFSKEIYPTFTDNEFKDCYSEKGRNAISPAFLSLVTILQWKESLSDTEATESVIRRLDWKIALHLPIDYREKFDPSTLCYFRRRLKENNKACIIFDKIIGLAQTKGFIKRRTKQRMDATHIITHINRISTTDLLFRSIKCLVEEIEQKDPDYYKKNIPEDIKERFSQDFSSFGLSKEKRGEKQAEIVEDGLYLKYLLETRKSSKSENLRQLEIMETIFKENIVIKEKEINGKIFIETEEIEGPKQTIFDPRDKSIKLGKKGGFSWVGSKCHVVETAEKGKINFITNMIQQSAPAKEILKHQEIREGNKKKGLEPAKIFVDQSYMSGGAIKGYEGNNQKLMGYVPNVYTNKHPDFQVSKFDINMAEHKAICPMGKQSIKWIEYPEEQEIRIGFNRNECIRCNRKGNCINSKIMRRELAISINYDYLRRRRKEQKSKKFHEEMKTRAQIEGTISELVRLHGLRRAKYKGEAGRQLQFFLSATGLNVKRLLRAITKGIYLPATT